MPQAPPSRSSVSSLGITISLLALCASLLWAVLNTYSNRYFDQRMSQADPFTIRQQPAQRSRIAIVSFVEPNSEIYRKMGQMSVRNKMYFASKFGYDLFVFHERFSWWRSAHWSKMASILHVMTRQQREYDWIFWVDIDTMAVNTRMLESQGKGEGPLEGLVRRAGNIMNERHSLDLIIANDHNGLNNGVFLIRNTEWSKQLLWECYDWRYLPFTLHNNQDQEAMKRQIRRMNPASRRIFYGFKQEMNAYPRDASDAVTWQYHLAGCSINKMPECFQYFTRWYREWLDTDGIRHDALLDELRSEERRFPKLFG